MSPAYRRGLSATSEATGRRVPSGWNHNVQYHDVLLDAVPVPCEHAIDLGCGDGNFVRRLAARSRSVTGIDVSPAMISRAQSLTADLDNVALLEGDILRAPLPEGAFDFVSAIAVLHHVPFAEAVSRMAALLRPGGVLAVLGLAVDRSARDFTVSVAAVPVSRLIRLRRGWWESGAPLVDPSLSYAEVRRAAHAILPGAAVRRRLLFRYSLVWSKP